MESTKPERAKQLLSRLEGLDKDFRSAHIDVVDLVEDDSPDIEKEYEAMDKHEDDVSSASLRLQALLSLTIFI